eukprot:506664-Prorocentrum_minimum.AAC.1
MRASGQRSESTSLRRFGFNNQDDSVSERSLRTPMLRMARGDCIHVAPMCPAGLRVLAPHMKRHTTVHSAGLMCHSAGFICHSAGLICHLKAFPG